MSKLYINDKYIPKTNLEKIIISYQNEKWNWSLICSNKNITSGFISNILNPNYLKFYFLSMNPNISNKFIEENIEKEWNLELLINNQSITDNTISLMIKTRDDWIQTIQKSSRITMEHISEIILEDPLGDNDIFYWDISSNPNLDFDFVDEFISENWKWGSLSINSKLNFNFLKKYIRKPWYLTDLATNKNLNIEWILLIKKERFQNYDIPKFWKQVSSHPNITYEHFRKYPYLPWSWEGFSSSPNIDIDIIIEYKDNNWDWEELSTSIYLSINDIESNFDLKWNWNKISSRLDLTKEFIKRHHVDLNFNYVSNSQCIDIFILEEFIERNWNFNKLSSHPNFDLKWLDKFPLEPWNRTLICKNSNISIIDIINNDVIGGHIIDPNLLLYNPNITIDYLKKNYKTLTMNQCDSIVIANKISDNDYSDISQKRCISRIDIIRNDLIIKTWNPCRLKEWCLDITELHETYIIT